MKKTKEYADKTKQNLIKAGIDLFSRKLYSDVKISDIAKSAGVSRGAFYWYFRNKVEFFKEINFLLEQEGVKIITNSVVKGNTVYERTLSILCSMLNLLKNDTEIKKICKLTSLNRGVLMLDDFKEWHRSYLKDEQLFYKALMEKIIEGTDIAFKDDIDDCNSKLDFIAAAAFLHGMINYITYNEELDIGLSETDIAKIINIFLTGLCS